MEIPQESKRNGSLHCSQCQKPLNPGAKFCPFCGKPTSSKLRAQSDEKKAQTSSPTNASLPVVSKEQIEQKKDTESLYGKPFIDEGIKTSTQYCPYCGAILSKAVSFCGKCGRFLDQRSAIDDKIQQNSHHEDIKAAETVSVASILAVLPPATLRSGFMGMKTEGVVLVLTQTHILFAQQTSALLKELSQQARTAAKKEGKGFFGQMGAQLGYYKVQRYLQMQPEEILNETSGNFQISNRQVRSIRLKRITDSDGLPGGVKMILRTDKSKLEYTFKNADKKQIKKLLQISLGDLVR